MDDPYRAPDPNWPPDDQVSGAGSVPHYDDTTEPSSSPLDPAAPPPPPPAYDYAPPPEPDAYAPPTPGYTPLPAYSPPPPPAPAYSPPPPPPQQPWQANPTSGSPSSGPLPQGYYQPGAPMAPPPQQPWQSGPLGGPAPSPSIPLPQGQPGYYQPSGPLPQGPQGYYQSSGPLPQGQPGYYPPQGQPGYYPPVVVVQQQSDNSGAAVAVECIAGFFGFYGIGWLMSGYTTTGVIMLICGFLWDAIYWTITALTIGFGLICLIPIDAAIWGTSAYMLHNKLKERQMTGRG